MHLERGRAVAGHLDSSILSSIGGGRDETRRRRRPAVQTSRRPSRPRRPPRPRPQLRRARPFPRLPSPRSCFRCRGPRRRRPQPTRAPPRPRRSRRTSPPTPPHASRYRRRRSAAALAPRCSARRQAAGGGGARGDGGVPGAGAARQVLGLLCLRLRLLPERHLVPAEQGALRVVTALRRRRGRGLEGLPHRQPEAQGEGRHWGQVVEVAAPAAEAVVGGRLLPEPPQDGPREAGLLTAAAITSPSQGGGCSRRRSGSSSRGRADPGRLPCSR
ncbi:hypothetical protein DAI22_10g121000 [Oryza sativa Japonica Group]|nr:hypothetical protein DAI22_10g121000 [Oryza sativa Japonica Group]